VGELNLGQLLDPWKDFGAVLKGELKRTVINLNLFLELSLGQTLTRAEYYEKMAENKKKIEAIDNEVNAALEKLPVGAAGHAILWAVAPGPMMAYSVREVSGKVTPDAVGNFMDEYGFTSLKLGPVPVGKLMKKVATGAAQVGGFATLNDKAMRAADEELEEKSKGKWWQTIEYLLLARPISALKSVNPFGESVDQNGKLLVEEEDKQEGENDEAKAFTDFLKLKGFDTQYNEKVGRPYVEARDEMITGLIDILEQEITETTALATAASFEDFVDAINKAKLEKFDKLNSSKIVSDMESQIDDMLQDEEGITKFVEAGGAKMDDFNENKDKLKSFVAQKLYEKEFTEVRIKSIESINDTVEEIKVEILDGLEEKQLKLLEQTLLGEQLLNSMEAAFERLDKASAKLKEVEKKAKAQ
jgi:hypothetical protein